MRQTKNGIYYLIYVIAGLFPFLYVCVHSLFVKQNHFLGLPHNSDEFSYWRVLYSFSNCGFDFASTCGYINNDAILGPLGEHGLATLFAWAPAILFGVNVHTLFIWNLLLLTISLLVFFLLIKPDCRVGVLILFMMLSNGVLMEQWYSHMMELPCVAVIVLYFTFQLMYERTNKKAWLVLTIVTCIYASFMRICYIVLLFPIIFLLCLERGKKIRIWPFVVYLIGFGIIYKGGDLFKKQSAGFLTSISSLGMKEKLLMLLDNTLRNLRLYFSIYNGSHVEVGQRYFQVGLLLLLFTVAFISFRDGLFSYTFRKVYL